MKEYNVVIIGSGLGGLLCGYILSKEGKSVCILEKNRHPGGLLRSFSRNGVDFETGFHYAGALGEGQVLNRYFRYFGLMDSVEFRKPDENGFDIIAFEDEEYPLAMGFDNFREHLQPFFPGQQQAILDYTAALQRICKAFPLYSLDIPKDNTEDAYQAQSALGFFHSFGKIKPSRPGNRRALSDVLAGNNFLYAGNPDRTPLHIAALINHSFITGARRPVGSTNHIADRLTEQIRHFGGKIFTGKQVTGIGKKDGVFRIDTSEGEQFMAHSLVSAIHPERTLAMTDPGMFRKAYSTRIMNLENTPSCFALYVVSEGKFIPTTELQLLFPQGAECMDNPR